MLPACCERKKISMYRTCFNTLMILIISAASAMQTGGQEVTDEKLPDKIALLPVSDVIHTSPRKPKLLGIQAVKIIPPWDTEGHLLVRFPETLHSSLGLLFIDHYRSDMLPVVELQKLPEWHLDPNTGALSYECKLPNNVEFTGSVVPGADVVDMKFTVRNNTDEELKGLNIQICLVQSSCPTFNTPELTHTYILHDGNWLALADSTFKKMKPDRPPWIIGSVKGRPGPKPGQSHPDAWYVCHEPADIPLIATVSKDSAHVLAITWPSGRSIMSNGMIPCLHADPVLPNCPPGESVSVEGKIYLLTGDLDDLKARL